MVHSVGRVFLLYTFHTTLYTFSIWAGSHPARLLLLPSHFRDPAITGGGPRLRRVAKPGSVRVFQVGIEYVTPPFGPALIRAAETKEQDNHGQYKNTFHVKLLVGEG